MLIGDILLAQNLVTPEDIKIVVHRQKENGGRLGENLVAFGALSQEQLDRAIYEAPQAPKSIEDTGYSAGQPDADHVQTHLHQ